MDILQEDYGDQAHNILDYLIFTNFEHSHSGFVIFMDSGIVEKYVSSWQLSATDAHKFYLSEEMLIKIRISCLNKD